MAPLHGLVEAPPDLPFVVTTVPVTATFRAVEEAMRTWEQEAPAVGWQYGNVYDEQGESLGWWRQPTSPSA
jgi:hypothetical protein